MKGGIYPARWHCAEVAFSGVSRYDLILSIDQKNGIRSYTYDLNPREGDFALLYKNDHSHVIHFAYSASKECTAIMRHDIRAELRQLFNGFCGTILYHFWEQVDGFRADFYDEVTVRAE